MANKQQVLECLKRGMTPREIADELGCLPAYARAVRARAFGNGQKTQEKYANKPNVRARTREAKNIRYRTDPEYRQRIIDAAARWARENPERRSEHSRNYYMKKKTKTMTGPLG